MPLFTPRPSQGREGWTRGSMTPLIMPRWSQERCSFTLLRKGRERKGRIYQVIEGNPLLYDAPNYAQVYALLHSAIYLNRPYLRPHLTLQPSTKLKTPDHNPLLHDALIIPLMLPWKSVSFWITSTPFIFGIFYSSNKKLFSFLSFWIMRL